MKDKELNSFMTLNEKYCYYDSFRESCMKICYSDKVLLLSCGCGYDPGMFYVLFSVENR